MRYIVILLFVLLSSCSYSLDKEYGNSARVSNLKNKFSKVNPGYHTVIKGDTLTSISKKYGVSLVSLTKANSISSKSTIFPGQELRVANLGVIDVNSRNYKVVDLNNNSTASLKKDKKSTSARVKTNNTIKSNSLASKDNSNIKVASSSSMNLKKGKWIWPAKGKVLRGFNSELTNGKGIHIQGGFKSSVNSIGDGVVVYSGSALKGYGNLIIIKHENNYLSAYAHNHLNVVKEGESVRAGQHIAQMGKYHDDSVLLHFELRKDGRPVDPTRYIRP